MQCIVYLGPQRPGSAGQQPRAGPDRWTADTLSCFARSWHHASRSWDRLLAPVGVLEQQRCEQPA